MMRAKSPPLPPDSRHETRTRCGERKATRSMYMVRHLKSREIGKIEGREFTLPIQKNSQIQFVSPTQVPMRYLTIAA